MEASFQKLLAISRELALLGYAQGVLGWDEQVNMPPTGAPARAEAGAYLAQKAHEILSSPQVGELLEKLSGWEKARDPHSFEGACIRRMRRNYEKAVKIPADLVAEMSRASSEGFQTWLAARQEQSFRLFAPKLERLVDLQRQAAQALGFRSEPYDALLDLFEEGTYAALVEEVCQKLEEGLMPLVHEVAQRLDRVDDSFLRGSFSKEAQWQLNLEALDFIGFDRQKGRLDQSAHPFTSGFYPGDVRLTTRFGDSLTSALFSTLHEGGHGLYEQGLPEAWWGTPVGEAASLGMHESQSRLWENVVGRSRPFWERFYPRVIHYFPELKDRSVEDFYRAVNRVEMSLIRVEADELTYNLHIFLRFRLERQMINGQLEVKDLPEVWNEAVKATWGRPPAHDGEGVLQDVHWSGTSMGYFPSYTFGNIYSLQLVEAARKDEEVARGMDEGNFQPLGRWMREHIHQKAGLYSGLELLEKVTGRGPDPQPYLAYLRAKYQEIYGF
ncbi:MAG: carboxypeptidase M32 [Clostridiales bacterium]|nr:carboxypeptidase M32 [Clostridiales bacterium]